MKKTLLAALAVATLAFAPLAGAQSITALQDGLNAFAEKSPASLPFAASAGMDWSNAYIGQLLDTDFPFVHLGVGLSVGATTIPQAAIGPLLEAIGVGTSQAAPLPFAVANARVGGILLPFDVGLKVGFLPSTLETVDKFNFSYQNFGLDVRYNLIKSDVVLPDVSVGGGINYLKAGLGVDIGEDQVFSLPTGPQTLTIGAPHLSIDFESLNFEAKAQVSKTLLYIVTPYVGATLGMGSAKASAGIKADVSSSDANLNQWEKYTGPLTALGFSKSASASPFFAKLYGGASLNVLVLKLDLQGMYNLFDGSIGGSAGVRVQL